MFFKECHSRKRRRAIAVQRDGFVVDGYDRLEEGVEAEIRAEVMAENSDEWNRLGFFRRVILHYKMERDTKKRVAEKLREVSPESLF